MFCKLSSDVILLQFMLCYGRVITFNSTSVYKHSRVKSFSVNSDGWETTTTTIFHNQTHSENIASKEVSCCRGCAVPKT